MNKKICIIMHVLPHEIGEFERILKKLKESFQYTSQSEIQTEIILDVTLNVNNLIVNWNNFDDYTKEMCIEDFNKLKKYINQYYTINFSVNDDNTCLGINDKRRQSIRTQDVSHFIYLDLDLHFSKYNLLYMLESISMIKNKYYIVSSQLFKLWDDSWDVISNDYFIDYYKKTGEKIWKTADTDNVEDLCNANLDSISLKPIPTIKFGGGWFNMFNSELLKFIDIPDSLGSYGLDDTFVMECALLMKQKGYDIQQYVLNNMLVLERNLFKNTEYVLNKETFRKNSHKCYEQEKINFLKKL